MKHAVQNRSIKIFGCPANTQIHQANRKSKVHDRATIGVFVGMVEGQKITGWCEKARNVEDDTNALCEYVIVNYTDPMTNTEGSVDHDNHDIDTKMFPMRRKIPPYQTRIHLMCSGGTTKAKKPLQQFTINALQRIKHQQEPHVWDAQTSEDQKK